MFILVLDAAVLPSNDIRRTNEVNETIQFDALFSLQFKIKWLVNNVIKSLEEKLIHR